jgi:3-oxoacyl-(acyl-carrier-protein) synthase
MIPAPVRIAGIGLVSSLGSGRAAVATRILAGEIGLHPVAGIITPLKDRVPVSQVRDMDVDPERPRNDELALEALRQALAEAGLQPRSPQVAAAALLVGSITGDSNVSETRYRGQLAHQGLVPNVTIEPPAGRVAVRLAEELGVAGPVLTTCSACTSSANAILTAIHMLRQGLVPRAIVVGTDILTATLLHGFDALMLLTPDGCLPFDRARKGIQVGEAAAALILELADDDSRTGCRDVLLLGGASRCDPFHMTASSPDGSGAEAVMRAACEQSGVEPSAIVAIKAHGTGTPDNDSAEGHALLRLFGDRIPPFASIKRYLGHTMGAAGTVELGAFVGCLEAGFVPACAGFAEVDPEVGVTPLRNHAPFVGGIVMLNYFGFGGNSVSLLAKVPRGEVVA